jgi:hypothetical protein
VAGFLASPGHGRLVLRAARRPGLSFQAFQASQAFLGFLAVLAAVGCAAPQTPLTRTAVVPAARPADREYLGELIAQARSLDLAHDRTWLRLGHYQSDGAGWQSQADGQNFFLAPAGKTDPAAELEATLAGFFATVPGSEKRVEIQHPACQFPARFLWLDRRLGFDRSRLAPPACPRFVQFRDQLDAASATLVFSSYYLSSPASAFGHTFLRINSRKTATGEKRELLDYGIDYAADVDTSNALLYAVKGLFGFFPGRFKRLPYYYKVREYGDYESRDIWEYQLAMTAAELELLVAHVWELGSTYFDYFYVSENCSYHVLGALEAAMPARDLLSQLRRPVVPADTIKALSRNPGLIAGVHFRPSVRTQFEARVQDLAGRERDLVERLVVTPALALPDDLPPARRHRGRDAAMDLVDMRYARELPFDPGGEGGRIKQVLGERRAEIALPSDDLVIAPPLSRQPHLGHGSRRVGLGAGGDRDGGPFAVLDLRLTMHDLADPSRGYPELAQLEFLPARLRIWIDDAMEPGGEDDRSPLQIDELWLVRIMALNAQTQFDRKLSWKAQVGLARILDEGCTSCTAATGTAGTGASVATRGGGVLGWLMVDGRVQWSPDLDGLGRTGNRLGVGPSAGFRVRLGSRLTGLVTGDVMWLPAQDPVATWAVDGTLRWHVTGPFALDLRTAWAREVAEGWATVLVYH